MRVFHRRLKHVGARLVWRLHSTTLASSLLLQPYWIGLGLGLGFSRRCVRHTYDFCRVSAKGVETFARLGAPELARLVERAGGDLVPKFQ